MQEPSNTQSTYNRLPFQMLLLWALLLLSAAGPQIVGTPIALPQAGRNLMLAVDISGSMQIPDMSTYGKRTDRLEVVKDVASDFIRRRTGDRIGLILFGTKAYLQTPLTFDRKTVLTMLEDATIGLAGPETAIGDAIGLATKRLRNTAKKSRVIILLTDGANNTGTLSPLQAADIAAKEGIRIYTIGIGAEKLIISGLLGSQMINPSADLDEQTLQKMADLTGGIYFRAKDPEGLKDIYKKLDQLEPIKEESTSFRPTHELYPWPLSIALLCTLLIMSQRISWRRN